MATKQQAAVIFGVRYEADNYARPYHPPITFSEMVRQMAECYREQPRKFHVIAARYYLGAMTADEVRIMATDRPCIDSASRYPVTHRAELTEAQANEIITNR